MKIKSKYNLIAYADTRQGGREENQDTCAYADTAYGFLIIVCDGMGGGPSGKLASMTAADAIISYIKSNKDATDVKLLIAEAIRSGDDAIRKVVAEAPKHSGMGTTVTLLLLTDYAAYVSHIGDSRVYQLRGAKKIFRTTDHSYVFQLVQDGELSEEEARTHEKSNIILKALGANIQYSDGEKLEVEVSELSYDPNDRFLLCTDGIWGTFPETDIISMATTPRNVAGAVENLVVRVDETGFDNGGHHDNLTIAIIQTKKYSQLKAKMSKRIKRLVQSLSILLLISVVINIFQFFHNTGSNTTDEIPPNPKTVNVDSIVRQVVEQAKDSISRAENGKSSKIRKSETDVKFSNSSMKSEDNKENTKEDSKKQEIALEKVEGKPVKVPKDTKTANTQQEKRPADKSGKNEASDNKK